MFLYSSMVPSIDKGKHGFAGHISAHAASKPLAIRQYYLRPFSCLDKNLLRQNCKHLTAMDFRVIFGFLWRRCVVTHQDKKGEKRRKDALSGVSALVNRWYGCKLLFVFKLYCRIFSKKLRDDLVWIYGCFSIIGFRLLVCKGKKQAGIYTVGADFGSIVQYVLCIWMLVF